MHDCKEVVALEAFYNQTGVGAGRCRVGAEDVEGHDRRVSRLAEQSSTQPIHVDGPAGRRAFAPVVQCFSVPLQITAGAVGKTAAANAVLSCERGECADVALILLVVAVAVAVVVDLDHTVTS